MTNLTLKTDGLKVLRTANPRLISYNVEMTEVTGGTFWKAYTDAQIDGTELVLGENDKLPDMRPITANGTLEIAPGGCTFILL